MGFGEDINHILYDFKWSEYYNIFLMSATFPKKVLNMVESLMKNEKYSFITHGNYLGEKEDANGNVKQRFYLIEGSYKTNIFDKKIDALFGLLKLLDGKTLIFANKKDDVMEITYRVEEYGYGIVSLIGDMDMNQRIISLNEFKDGNVNLMVASDVASRGLDIPDVSYVINFDMPQNIDIYVHRIGRTGRVGNQGNSLTLLTREDQPVFRPLFELLSKSNCIEKIYCVPGNPAIAASAECINIALSDLTGFCEFVKEKNIDITIPFDEYVIYNGIANIFQQENLRVYAPTYEAAQISASRAFGKKFIYKQKIPTVKYGVFDREASAIDYLKKSDFPVVIRYDHIAHSDSFLCPTFSKAKEVLEKVFFDVGKKVVIEEFPEGEIIRLSILTDGYSVVPFPYVKEYDRAQDGNNGELTNGVGAYAPFAKIS